jgi:putative heme transporter
MAEPRSHSSRRRLWRALQIGLAVAIAAGIFFAVIPHVADYGSVWQVLSRLSVAQLTIVAGVAALNLVTYWIQSIAAMPGLTLAMAAVQTQTTTTVANTIPGGGAIAVGLSYAMFRSWG